MEKVYRCVNSSKLIAVIMIVIIGLSATACLSGNRVFDISIRMPAGDSTVVGTSDEEIIAKSGTITISCAPGTPDAAVSLLPTSGGQAISNIYLTHGMPVKIDVQKGCSYKISIQASGTGNAGYDYVITVKNVELRIQ